MSDRKIYWRCFHCAATFTKAQERHARDHFGMDQGEKPVCLICEPGEYHVLRALRKAQAELENYREDDTELHRALHAMSSDHRQALIREEERGYEKGLADGRALSTAPRASSTGGEGELQKALKLASTSLKEGLSPFQPMDSRSRAEAALVAIAAALQASGAGEGVVE